jgi:5-methyltetrahydrofolate--homocysteine methyltransferase
VVYVKDASRAVGVASALLSDQQGEEFREQIRNEYQVVREQHAGRQSRKKFLSLEAARSNATSVNWDAYVPPVPQNLDLTVIDSIPLNELRDYIDWTPFFNAWELAGRFPRILNDEIVGTQATQLYQDAQQMLDMILEQQLLTARAVFQLFPANSRGDDIITYSSDQRDEPLMVLHHLRQQNEKPPGKPNQCLADFVAPEGSGLNDYVGAFAVTAGDGLDVLVEQFEADHDDYSAIMAKALADRFAEAAAEWLHEKVRKQDWGYAAEEQLDNEQLIRETYRGVRPAPGYPACPDHTEKASLWQMIQPDKHIGIDLTESFAMLPMASVSGFYFSHPEARYFAVGKIEQDQVKDYASRKNQPLDTTERWLAPVLNYDR